MNHTFTMERLTIGDFIVVSAAAKASDVAMMLPTIDKARDGGIVELPIAELPLVVKAFVEAYAAYFNSLREARPDGIAQLLKQALGEE